MVSPPKWIKAELKDRIREALAKAWDAGYDAARLCDGAIPCGGCEKCLTEVRNPYRET